MPLSHTQDTGGPLARSLEDLAIILDLTVGFDPADPATQALESGPTPQFIENLYSVEASELRLGKLTSYFDSAGEGTRVAIEEALSWYQAQGATIRVHHSRQ